MLRRWRKPVNLICTLVALNTNSTEYETVLAQNDSAILAILLFARIVLQTSIKAILIINMVAFRSSKV